MNKVIVAAVAVMSAVNFSMAHANSVSIIAASSGNTMIELKPSTTTLLDSSHSLRIDSSEIPLQPGIDKFTTNVNFVVRAQKASSFWVYYDNNRCGWDTGSLKLLDDVKSGKQASLMIHKLNIDIKSETACVAIISGATLS